MKRRNFVRAIAAALPAAGAIEAQQPGTNQSAPGVPLNPTVGTQPPGRAASEELPKLEPSVPDVAADAMPRFFNAAQFSALERLSDVLMPPMAGAPGAKAVGAPEFLDFLIGRSDAARKGVYTSGLDELNSQAKKRYGKSFAATDASEAEALLAPLKQTWTFEEPSDAVARFLRVAKADIRTATVNSREFSAGRRFAGSGLYWYPLD